MAVGVGFECLLANSVHKLRLNQRLSYRQRNLPMGVFSIPCGQEAVFALWIDRRSPSKADGRAISPTIRLLGQHLPLSCGGGGHAFTR